MGAFPNVALCTQMGIRANNRPRLNPGPFQNTHGTDENAIRNIRIANHAVGANPAIAPNACVTENLYERLDGRIGADLNFTINHTGLSRQNCDPFRHKLPAFGQTQALINIYQFGSHVAAQNLVGIVCLNRDHALFRLTQNGRHIREIKLSVHAEFYLTDMAAILGKAKQRVVAVEANDAYEILGGNMRAELVDIDQRLRLAKCRQLMTEGVTILSTQTCVIDSEVQIGADTTIEPFVQILGNTRIGNDCRIPSYSVMRDSEIADGVLIR